MTPQFWLGVAGLVLPIVGWLIYHVMHDREVQSDLKARVHRIEQDIGTRDTGITGSLHRHGNLIGRLQGVLEFIMSKLKLSIKSDDDE